MIDEIEIEPELLSELVSSERDRLLMRQVGTVVNAAFFRYKISMVALFAVRLSLLVVVWTPLLIHFGLNSAVLFTFLFLFTSFFLFEVFLARGYLRAASKFIEITSRMATEGK